MSSQSWKRMGHPAKAGKKKCCEWDAKTPLLMET